MKEFVVAYKNDPYYANEIDKYPRLYKIFFRIALTRAYIITSRKDLSFGHVSSENFMSRGISIR